MYVTLYSDKIYVTSHETANYLIHVINIVHSDVSKPRHVMPLFA